MTVQQTTPEPSFRESVDLMFNRAVALMDLSPGLEEKIRVCNATYTVRFGVRSVSYTHLTLPTIYSV